MSCQYCHSKEHDINNCPIIICRYCKQVGHPKWLCKNKDKNIKNKKHVEKNIEYYLKLKEYKWSDIINNVKF
jgi:hypothetical protein